MAHLAPPPPPLRVTVIDHDGNNRLNLRLQIIALTILTILVTAWFCTLGPIPAVLALVVAKHVLVAILVMGLGVDAKTHAEF